MKNRILIALRSFIISIGATAAGTFIGVTGVFLGSNATEMGWLQSASNSISNGAQLLWGRLSDKVGRRKPFLIIGSGLLAVLWYIMEKIRDPIQLIIVYSAIAFLGAMITVNWFSLIGDQIKSSERGHFLSVVNILGSVGAVISLVAMVFLFKGSFTSDIAIPFSLASITYVVSVIIVLLIDEPKHVARKRPSAIQTLKQLKSNRDFYKYFMAMNIQGIFWSMAWPMFPITIVLIMHFNLSQVAILTIVSSTTSMVIQYMLGRVADNVKRPPLIFANRLMLSAIPLMYAFMGNFTEFIFLEIYSGFLGSIQNVVMTSYMLDLVPEGQRAEYIAIINGFNGLIYLIGALSGGYLLSFMELHFMLKYALIYSYIIVFSGRLISSFLFLRLNEVGSQNRVNFSLYSLIYRYKEPGQPSGGTIKFR